ncbi:MAG: YeeE/YedE family protein [Myxococcales bacterium]|jgi:uncharacterized membrane protein YedE/YeeE
MQSLTGAVSGIVFGLGLVLGGMTRPAKVLAFLDFAGDWDPSLAFVMGGAIAVYAPLYRYIIKNTTPMYTQSFMVVANKQLDKPLLIGAAVFGTGWGLAGYCPGPGIVSAGSGATAGLVFVLSMVAGMLAFEAYQRVAASVRAARADKSNRSTAGA